MNKQDLTDKILNRTALVAVIGLGYVGLPFAVECAKAGFTVVGVDSDADKVDKVNSGENYIGDVDSDELRKLVKGGKMSAVRHIYQLDPDVIVICVPTPLTKNHTPDISFIESASLAAAGTFHPWGEPCKLITLESTTYPGTTEEVILPIIEQEAGVKHGKEFYLAHSPERVDPGNRTHKTRNTTKVVGGVDKDSSEMASLFYSQVVDKVHVVSDAQTAEMSKIFENTFRAVNIGLVNEMALLCDKMGIDVWEMLDAAFTKPFGIMPFYPGPGVGGHCIAVDPYYLEWKAREFGEETRFISTAGVINRTMPKFVVQKAVKAINNEGKSLHNASVLVVGAAYKRDIDDWRESPAVEIIEELYKRDAEVSYYDPYVPRITVLDEPWSSIIGLDLDQHGLLHDLVIIATDHSCIDYEKLIRASRLVLDTRNATKEIKSDKVIKL